MWEIPVEGVPEVRSTGSSIQVLGSSARLVTDVSLPSALAGQSAVQASSSNSSPTLVGILQAASRALMMSTRFAVRLRRFVWTSGGCLEAPYNCVFPHRIEPPLFLC